MEVKKASGSRIRSVDIAKGIGMICIILGHLNSPSINRFVYTFHVPIFFLIGGYFISEKRSVAAFVKSKAKTLLIPYCISCVLIITLGTLKGYVQGNAPQELREWVVASLYGAGGTLNHPFHIRGIGAIWFLLASFWGSVCIRFSLLFNERKRLALITALFFFGLITKKWIWLPFSLQEGACSSLYLYLGFLYRKSEKKLNALPTEIKCFGLLFALVTWISFIKDFKSFWLVQCNFGRGAVDIFGSVCACVIVLLVSKVLDSKTKLISKFFAFFGRYSLLVLCVHTIELNLFPWTALTHIITQAGIPAVYEYICIIIGKLVLNLLSAWLLSKSRLVKKLFGYTEKLN